MTYVIAGGGTGGHVYPAIAVADSLKKLDPNVEILFIGTQKGLEKDAVPNAGYPIEFINISGIKGRSYLNKLNALIQLPKAVLQSIFILKKSKAKAILGVGGYASGPALIAAKLLRIPTAVCEPNSVPGLTNRILGKVSDRVFTNFESTKKFFQVGKISSFGNPIRGNLTIANPKFEKSKDSYNILIIGGSQGARALNEKLPEVFSKLQSEKLDICIRHQTGGAELDKTRELYRKLDIKATVEPFIHDMNGAYSWADLIICRSGAATCSEVLAVGPVAVFIPLPNAIYDHQMLNAKELERQGACLVVPQDEITAEGLAHKISALLKDSNKLESLLSNARKLAKPDASNKIAKSFINCFSIWTLILCGIPYFTVA